MIENFKENIITKDIFDEMVRKEPYYENRWEYFNEIIELLNQFDDIHSVLEIGPYKLPFVKHSDIIDIYGSYLKDVPFETGEFIKYDCSKLPLPFEDKSYDLVIACQVIEHFGYSGQQIEFFKDLERICDKAIISLPFLWHKPAFRGHHMIDRKVINTWTGKRKPSYELISGNKNHLRILQLYEFDKENEGNRDYIIKAKKEDAKIISKRVRFDIDKLISENQKLKEDKDKLREDKDKLKDDNEKLKAKNLKLKKEKSSINNELNALKNTTSWKMTKPLRVLKSKF